MKKLLLINPVGRRSGYLLSRFTRFPPLSLAFVAAVTPDTWKVEILDETFDPCTWEEADLVGITAFTSNVNRAYEIAEGYRKKNIPVIMGGIHASMLPDEALRYCTAVVAGEVEQIWGRVLEDFENGRLSGIYRGPQVDFSKYDVIPRRDLLHPAYIWNPIQTSRGCPFDCSFCSVTRYLGKKYRQRSAESVLGEIESISGKKIVFLDDNLIGYSPESRRRAIRIFDGMIERNMKKKWWMQASINVADDDEVLRKAAAAGCTHVFIGFETRDLEMLRMMKKGINLRTGIGNYKAVIERLHGHGIGVLGAFIIGNDYETTRYYRELTDFIIDAGVDIVQISILTPLPGTELMERMQREERLLPHSFPEDWKKFRLSQVTFKPVGMTEKLIYTANNYIKKSIYTFPRYQIRIFKSFMDIKNFKNACSVAQFSSAMKRGWKHAHYYSGYPHDFGDE